MKLVISSFLSFWLRSILWATENSWLLCRLLKSLLLYSDVNIFCKFYLIFQDYLFFFHSSKEPVMSSIHNQWITNDFWISSALMFVVSCLIGVILCYGERSMTGQVVMDRIDPWCSDFIGIFASAPVSCFCWNKIIVVVVTNICYILWCDMFKVFF